MVTGARVRNAYATCLLLGDSLSKERLTPDGLMGRHLPISKGNGKRWACVRLASWRGNGPPRLRSVGVLRGWSPTLALRYGPDSYGRQQ